MRSHGQRGSVTVMFIVVAVFFFTMISFLVEGGRKLGNISRAQDLASEAARAAAATLDIESIADGQPTIDTADGRARSEAEAIVSAAGAEADLITFAVSASGQAVSVVVEVDGTSWIPGFDISGRATHTAQVIDPAVD